MAANPEALGTDLKSFLAEATQAYAEGSVSVHEGFDKSRMASFESGRFNIIDRWDTSPDQRTCNGTESVFKDNGLVWKAAYHGAVVPEADPTETMAFYAEALKQPDPELPIRGPRRLEVGNNVYSLQSLRGPLEIGRFAVVDQIHQDGKCVYDGHTAGGWM